MAFAHLLHFARIIKLHQLDRPFLFKTRNGRIVERNVSVFTDAEAAQVNRLGAQ